MEPSSTIAIVIGLVGSLSNTLRLLHDFAFRFALEEFGQNFNHDEIALEISYRGLVEVQGNFSPRLMHPQLDELLVGLVNIEQRLHELTSSVREMEKFRTKLLLSRRPNQSLLRHDIEVAKSSIHIAMKIVDMIRYVQGGVHDEKMLIENTRSRSRDLMSQTEDLTETWQSNHSPASSTPPDTRFQQIFSWVAGPQDQSSFHDQCRDERIRGTCEWILDTEEFQTWLRNPIPTDNGGVFWCRGRAGIGKTMLASKIIDELRSTQFVVYFYMNSGRKYSASDVTASLLRQLCLPFQIMPERLKQLYERSNGEFVDQLNLEDMLEALRQTSRDIREPITIVLDGLDESNMREQKAFVKFLKSLQETSWKCLITSRPDQDILPRACDCCPRLSIEDSNIAVGIRKFVDSAIKGNGPVDKMLYGHPELRSEVIGTLTSRAQGMFHWVILQVQFVLDQTHISGIRRALQNIPRDITEIFQSAFDMIRLQGKARSQIAIRTLALLTIAVAPVTAGAVCHALGVAYVLDFDKASQELSEDEIPNSSSIIECCMGLIVTDPVTDIVTVSHHDIAQHMRENCNVFFPGEKARLARTSMAYLSLVAFSSGPCRQASAFSKRLEQYPFLEYASRHWGHHARVALLLEENHADIRRYVDRLLQSRENLESSLQVADVEPEAREALLRGKRQGFTLDTKSFGRISELQVAARHGLTMSVQRILKTNPRTVSSRDAYGTSALHEAAQAGWGDIVRMLLDAGAEPFPIDDEEKTPFYYAAKSGHIEITSTLQDYPAITDLERLRSPVFHAARNGHKRTVAPPRGHNEALALEEAFCDAAEEGNAVVLERWLRAGVNPNYSKNGISALTIAIQGGHDNAVRVLLANNTDCSCPDRSPSHQIPLHQAIGHSNVDIAAMLLDHGANIKTRDEFERTALFETLNTPDLDGAVLLLARGIQLSPADREGDTVLHQAAPRGAVEHASLYLDQGIEMNVLNNAGLTPLHLATHCEHYRLVDLLVRKGADVNIADPNGRTALMYVASAGNAQFCQKLISFGAFVDTMAKDHTTPLTVAAAAGHAAIVQLLLEHGANTNALGSESREVHMLAAKTSHV